MNSHAPNLNYLWTSTIIEELCRHKVNHFSISPGSRSTPLTLAAAQHPNSQIHICLDERGAAFHALGYARATGLPGVLICTSGSALANYFPAVVEAATDNIPMLIFSADRPPELRETGANQTIRQPAIFGEYVRWAFDFPCPDEKIPLETVLTTIDHAVHRAKNGPVHLNFMFREPLAPVDEKFDHKTASPSIHKWRRSRAPYTRHETIELSLLDPHKNAMSIVANKRGMIVVGKQVEEAGVKAIVKLAERLMWPIFPDIASGLRIGTSEKQVVHYYDQILLSDQVSEQIQPEIILQFGGRIVSKRLLQFIEKIDFSEYIFVAGHDNRDDPSHRVTQRFFCSTETFVQSCRIEENKSQNSFSANLFNYSRRVHECIDRFLQQRDNISEPGIARSISQNILPDSGLFLGNSMPVRDMDMFASPSGPSVRIGVNRGASGIDGNIASAIGFAKGLGKPVTLFCGDLTFLHDLNSLALLDSSIPRMLIVVVNNDGGGIFSFLPVAQFKNHFEKCFGTPHGLHFENAAQMFGLEYFLPETMSEFTKAYLDAQKSGNHTIIEVKTNRLENADFHRILQEEIRKELEQ